MNNQGNNKMEDLIDKVMRDASIEVPSVNFTSNLMNKIHVEEQKAIYFYKPLISKKGWGILGILLIGIFFYSSLLNMPIDGAWLNFLDLGDNNLFHVFSNWSSSRSSYYLVVFLGAFILVQIPMLKYFFDKRIEG